MADFAGIRMQPDLTSTALDFSFYDQYYGAVPPGMRILANVSPQAHTDVGYCLAGSYLPVDEQKYVAFVKAAVGRYSGASSSAAAGLASPIKHWQVGNEPNNSQTGFADLGLLGVTSRFLTHMRGPLGSDLGN